MRYDELCLSHSTECDEVIVPASNIIKRYIEYRLASEKKMLDCIDKTGTISKADLFKQMYGDRDLSTPYEHSLVECNFN